MSEQKHNSIRTRLVLCTLVLLAVLVIALSVSVYFLARGSIWRSFRDGLTAEARSFASMVEYERSGSFDIEIPHALLSRFDPGPECEYYRVFDSLGISIARSRSLGGNTELWQPPPNWLRQATLNDTLFRRTRMAGEEKGLLSLKCLPRMEQGEREEQGKEEEAGENLKPPGLTEAAIVVQVTRSTAPVRRLLGRLRTILLGGSLLTLGAAALGSHAVARMGLRPVRELASRVEGINEDTLGTRVPREGLPEELIPLADKTNEMLCRIETAFQREKRFTSDAAHEIRTPLSALITGLEVALRKDRSPQEYRQTMTECLSSARNLKQLTDSLLFLAALDAGKVQLQARPVDIGTFVDEIVNMYGEEARRREISVTANIAVSEVTLEPDLLSTVLNNLISNAIEYCRPGDSVSVSAHMRDSDKALCIEVADTGPGISRSDIKKLFYRFYRGRQERETGTAHAGLGLAIAAKAAAAMGGQIEVESELGKGSTFRCLILPGE